ncbi:phosphoglycolate phosphatase [Thermoproteus tenax]|uniref:Phosphoglycolate phosphatase n=1 Tax=Thermoproteus tenax (strain ATCC 35583 / DSM 2078 / JCM 9277 / NBRC 100435 / Kra 1) TaxID=768679 RepID=G4RP88_THETK|nr:phosphoglycolate phosphatase [Thermoproteus tenax]CCC81383.1 hydrolase of the HAD superfamily [Thermoproteus tenax Kra 1]
MSYCKGLVADIDGTLTLSRSVYELSLEALAALRRAKNSGLKVALATANGLDYALALSRYLGIDSVIAENGCIIYYDGKTYRLCKEIDKQKVIETALSTGLVKESEQNRCREFDLAFYPVSEPGLAVESLKSLLGEKYAVEYSGYAIHVRPRGVDKGVGLAFICRLWGIPCNLVAVVGDSEVDVPMLKLGWGIAVGNADDRAKEAARLTVEESSGLGFAEAVDLILRGIACID